MNYQNFLEKTSYTQEDLLTIAHRNTPMGTPAEAGSLPAPPLLMIDRVTELSRDPTRRWLVGEKDVRVDDWFFQCHFIKDPVQPGCLGVDAIWQLLGFYIALRGGVGSGRALGVKEVDFFGQIRPHN